MRGYFCVAFIHFILDNESLTGSTNLFSRKIFKEIN